MSLYSACLFRYPKTTKGFGTSCLVAQEKTSILKCRFYNLCMKPLRENHQKIINKSTRKYHQQLCMYSSKDWDLSDARTNKLYKFKELLRNIYVFSRPYTLMGTIMGITSISLLTINSWAQMSPFFLVELLKAIVPLLLMNFYSSGLNQIYDVEMDKVNKPYLPLASGAFSMKFAIGIVIISLVMSLGMGIRSGSPALLASLISWGLLGSLYSIELPYMRWKKSPFLSACCIVIFRTITVPLPYFIHMQKYVFGEPIVLSRGVIFAVFFTLLFSSAIALTKDIPDIDGDKLHDYKSLTVRLGQKRVLLLSIGILMIAYGGAMVTGLYSTSLLSKIVTVLGHLSLATILMNEALRVNINSKESAQGFYMFVWKLFYAEYFLIPFVR